MSLRTTNRPTKYVVIGTNWPKWMVIMPFPPKRFRMSPYMGRVFLPELVTRDKGNGQKEIVIEKVEQVKDLPDFELFDLENQLNAGVDLKQVNYKMFSADSFPVDGIMQEQTNKQEQINKQEQSNKDN